MPGARCQDWLKLALQFEFLRKLLQHFGNEALVIPDPAACGYIPFRGLFISAGWPADADAGDRIPAA